MTKQTKERASKALNADVPLWLFREFAALPGLLRENVPAAMYVFLRLYPNMREKAMRESKGEREEDRKFWSQFALQAEDALLQRARQELARSDNHKARVKRPK